MQIDSDMRTVIFFTLSALTAYRQLPGEDSKLILSNRVFNKRITNIITPLG